ncbi:MAG: hypothetical protein KJS91_05765 [Planctomycetes bacterium]|nr:hypothetical protein [Planctomycetota bacterium]
MATVGESGKGRWPGAGWLGAALAGGLLAGPGCATLWDDVTSREFKFNEMFSPSPPPLQVLETSQDGDKRARALSRLTEPARHGGTPAEQDTVVRVLVDSATGERQALCRIRALESMRNFHDPRIVEGIKESYYRAGSFSPEIASVVRIQALEALGHGGRPEGLDLLLKVALEPVAVGAEQDRQMKVDERMAAVRGLANYPEAKVAAALVEIMRKEKDIALLDKARQSMEKITRHRGPKDAAGWAEYLAKNPTLGTRHWYEQVMFWQN